MKTNKLFACAFVAMLIATSASADGFGTPGGTTTGFGTPAAASATTSPSIWEGFYGSQIDFDVSWASNNAGQGVGFTSPGGTTTVESISGMIEDVTASTNLSIGPGCNPADCDINSVDFDGAWTAWNDVTTTSVASGNGLSATPIAANSQAMTAGRITGNIGVTWESGMDFDPFAD